MTETKQNEFQLILQGEKHDIDANILAETIQNFDLIIREINEELKPEYPLNLRVKTFEEGSFEILFALLSDPTINTSLFSLLSKDNLSIAGNVISTFADILSIKDFLGGKKPSSIENTGDNQTKIENNKGEVKIVNKKSGDIIFNNPVINLTINNTFNTLKKETEIEGMKFVSDLNNQQVEILKSNFLEIANSDLSQKEIENIEIAETRNITKENTPLSIFKIVFDEKYKWQFLDNNGQKISATIKDKEFFEKVRKRELYFTNGDVLFADIEVTQEYNEIAKAYENKSYTITDIRDIKHQPTQMKIDI